MISNDIKFYLNFQKARVIMKYFCFSHEQACCFNYFPPKLAQCIDDQGKHRVLVFFLKINQ